MVQDRSGREASKIALGSVARTFALGVGLLLACESREGNAPPRSSGAASTVASPEPANPRRRAPVRVASLSPVATALLLELGQAGRIVAVDARSARLSHLASEARIPADEDRALQRLTDGVAADLVILEPDRIGLSRRLEAAQVPTLVAELRDFDDGFALWTELAGRFGLASEARARIADAARPLARISAESYGRTRPRVAVIDGFEPLALVGDEQFATGLVEIAGGENVTHGLERASIPASRESLRALAPELLVHVRADPLADAEIERLAARVADLAPLVVVRFDSTRFFTPEAVDAARTLRAAISPRSRPLVQPAASDVAERVGPDGSKEAARTRSR